LTDTEKTAIAVIFLRDNREATREEARLVVMLGLLGEISLKIPPFRLGVMLNFRSYWEIPWRPL
jgi:hypothetical protein